ncbi:MAG: amino acid ABC transporter substrate-binding protein [Desulfobacteraceae bacterium]|nr:amino acid ABC transporter substrate-binding protein [Desulfobacteraceae bacterium]
MKRKNIIKAGAAVALLGALAYWHLCRPVKIGVILSTDTTMGNEENLAVRFYRELHPKIGLRPVEYIIKNPSTDEKQIIQAYRELEQGGVCAILGGSISKTGIIIAKQASRSGIPTFGITTSTHTLDKKKDHFYRITTSSRFIGSNVTAYLTKSGVSRLAILTCASNRAYADPLAEMVQKTFRGKILKISFTNGQEALRKMWAHNPDAVFIILPETDLIQVLQAIRHKNSELLVLCTEWGFDKVASMFSGPILNGVQSFTRRLSITPKYRGMLHQFENLYEIRASFGAVNTFSCLALLYQAIETAGPYPDKINGYLEQSRILDSGYGKVFMTEFGDSIMQFHYIREIADGRVVLKEKIKIEQFPWNLLK